MCSPSSSVAALSVAAFSAAAFSMAAFSAAALSSAALSWPHATMIRTLISFLTTPLLPPQFPYLGCTIILSLWPLFPFHLFPCTFTTASSPQPGSWLIVTVVVTLQRALLSDLDKRNLVYEKDASAPRCLARPGNAATNNEWRLSPNGWKDEQRMEDGLK